MSQSQSDFGKLLQGFRKTTQDPQKNNRPLTQERFAEELESVSHILYTYGTISGWERGAISIHHQDRSVLLGILQVLRRFKGLFSIEEANKLLRAGGYRALDQTELATVDADWLDTKPAVPSLAPITAYLVGRQREMALLSDSLKRTSSISMQFVVGRAGIGKTILAQALMQEMGQQFDKQIWVDMGSLHRLRREALMMAILHYLREEFDEHRILERAKSVEPLKQQVRLLLNRHPSLVIIDGVETAEQCDLLATLLVNLSPHSKIIVTSRIAPQVANQVGVCFVSELTLLESERLLRDHLRAGGEYWVNDLTGEQIVAIYNIVGGHPLSLLSLPKLLRVQSLTTLLQRIQRGQGLALDQIYAAVWQDLPAVAHQIIQSLCFCSSVGTDLPFLVGTCRATEDEILDGLYMLQQAALLHTVWLDVDIPPLYSLHPLTKRFACLHHQESLPDVAQSVFRYWFDWLPHVSTASVLERHVLDHIAVAVPLSLSLSLDAAVATWRTDLVVALLPYIQHLGDKVIWQQLIEQLFHTETDKSNPKDRYLIPQLQNHLAIGEGQQKYVVPTSRARFAVPFHTHPERFFQYLRRGRI